MAPGSGAGQRCPNHGGVPSHGTFVLLLGLEYEDRYNGEGLDPRRWTARIVPVELWRAVTLDGARDFDLGLFDFRAATLASDPLRRQTARWPQLVGLRVARRLLERGRISHAVVDSPRTARKLRTVFPPSWTDEKRAQWFDEHARLVRVQ